MYIAPFITDLSFLILSIMLFLVEMSAVRILSATKYCLFYMFELHWQLLIPIRCAPCTQKACQLLIIQASFGIRY